MDELSRISVSLNWRFSFLNHCKVHWSACMNSSANAWMKQLHHTEADSFFLSLYFDPFHSLKIQNIEQQ